MARPQSAQSAPRRPRGSRAVHTLEVRLIGGPVTETFVEANPVVSRTIQVPGNHTLQDLHFASYRAFDRDDEHLSEFQIGGRKPHVRKARAYGHPSPGVPALGLEPDSTISARSTRIDSLGLKPRNVFYYRFDFGDDWWHRINMLRIEDAEPGGKLPQIVERVGASPPQYPFAYEDDEEEDEYEDEAEEGTGSWGALDSDPPIRRQSRSRRRCRLHNEHGMNPSRSLPRCSCRLLGAPSRQAPATSIPGGSRSATDARGASHRL